MQNKKLNCSKYILNISLINKTLLYCRSCSLYAHMKDPPMQTPCTNLSSKPVSCGYINYKKKRTEGYAGYSKGQAC